MKGHSVADIVVIFKTLPTKESVVALSHRIISDFRENYPTGIHIADGWFNLYRYKIYKYFEYLFLFQPNYG